MNRVYTLGFAVLVALLAGCSAPAAASVTVIVPPAGNEAVGPTLTTASVAQPVSEAHVVAVDVSGSYPAEMARAALLRLADELDERARRGIATMVWVRTIGAFSNSADSRLAEVSIPAFPDVASAEAPPTPGPSPTPRRAPSPETKIVAQIRLARDAEGQRLYAERETQIHDAYATRRAAYEAHLAAARRQTDALRALQLPEDLWASDQASGLFAAAAILRQATAGTRGASIVSDMEPTGPGTAALSSSVDLSGIDIRVVDFECYVIARCQALHELWNARFRESNARSVAWFHPGAAAPILPPARGVDGGAL